MSPLSRCHGRAVVGCRGRAVAVSRVNSTLQVVHMSTPNKQGCNQSHKQNPVSAKVRVSVVYREGFQGPRRQSACLKG